MRALTGEHWGQAMEHGVKQALLCIMTLPLLSGCATDPYGGTPLESRMMTGVLVGGALGALGGTAAGTNAVTGAAVGMIAGGAVGAAIPGHPRQAQRYYRDSRGYCYYVDQSGQPVYAPAVQC